MQRNIGPPTNKGSTGKPRDNTQQLFECYQQGSVVAGSIEGLLQRAQGLCGLASQPTYNCHELIYTMVNATQTGGPVRIRARKFNVNSKSPPIWQLYHIAPNEPSRNGVLLRGITLVDEIVGDPQGLLEAMGFMFDYEVYKEGHIFTHDGVNIAISMLYKLETRGNIETKVPITSSALVEVSAVATSIRTETMSKTVAKTAESLA
eukprot:Ihof_evm2s196 gene=Ihof_evmTU2s196